MKKNWLLKSTHSPQIFFFKCVLMLRRNSVCQSSASSNLLSSINSPIPIRTPELSSFQEVWKLGCITGTRLWLSLSVLPSCGPTEYVSQVWGPQHRTEMECWMGPEKAKRVIGELENLSGEDWLRELGCSARRGEGFSGTLLAAF